MEGGRTEYEIYMRFLNRRFRHEAVVGKVDNLTIPPGSSTQLKPA